MMKTDALRDVRDAVLNLKESPLYEYRTAQGNQAVLGEGSHDASIVFVGEAPGKNEAKTGRPFCGASGKILDQLLESIGISRSSIYITNIVKDRPPENRDPLPEEIAIYGPYLDRQIDIIRPKVLVALGRFSASYLFALLHIVEVQPISATHGKVYQGTTPYGGVAFVPLYHPAAAIYNQALKPTLIEDFQVLKQFIS